MKHFLKRLLGFSIGPVIGAIISLIQMPLFASLMPPEAVGDASTFQQLLVNIPNFIYLGLDQSYSREYHLVKDKRNLMQQATLIPMMLGMALFGIFILFASQISQWLFKDAAYYYLVWYAGIWLLSTIVERFILMTIRMEEKAIEYSIYNLMLKIGTFLVSLALIFMGMKDFTLIVYGLIFGQLLGDLVLFINYRHLLDIRNFNLETRMVKQMLIFGLPLMISSSVTSALNVMDISFLTSYSTKFDRGIYTHAGKLGAMFGIIKTAFSSFWVPTAFRWYKEDKSMKHYQFISEGLLLGLTVVFFLLVLLKEPITWVISFGKQDYMEAQYIIALLCFPHIMYTLSETTTLGIAFSRKTYYNILVSLVSVLPSIILNYLLTPVYGYRGASFASAIAYIVFYLARTYFSKQTGFYFPQKRQILSILLMFSVALLNSFEIEHLLWYTLLAFALTLWIQKPTVDKAINIKNNADSWDFS